VQRYEKQVTELKGQIIPMLNIRKFEQLASNLSSIASLNSAL